MKMAKKIVHDKDMAKVGAALRRAALQARKIAERTRTPLIVYEQGRVKRKMIAKQTNG
jgi:hypothetical protein